MLAFELKDLFPIPWLQIPGLIVAAVIIVLYIRWKRKQV
jgi:hypothetical protein